MKAEIPTIETSRLTLRKLALSDADAVQALFPKWEIVRFMSSRIPWPYPVDGAKTFIRDVALPAMKQGTEWHWSIRYRSASDQMIGLISLMDKPGDNRGFWLDPSWQGQGLMSEAVSAVTEYWFVILGRPVLQAPKAAINVRSRRLSQRTGMRLIATDERDYVAGRLPAELWEITREEWLRNKQA